MTSITKWTNMCQGFFAFTCEAIDPSGKLLEVSTFYCWILKLNLVIEILMMIPFISLLRTYHRYYGNQWFRSRQRVIYLCLLTLFVSLLSFSVINVIAFYQISFFMTQILFWHVLGYFITKVEKLATGRIVACLKIAYWMLLIFYIGYIGALMVAPLPADYILCPGLIDTEYWVYKCVLVACLVILDIYTGILLRVLLSKESDTLLDNRSRRQRKTDFIKLWTLLVVVSLAEFCHLIITIVYYSGTFNSDQCNILGGDETGTYDGLLVLLYRAVILYAPLLAMLWMIWIRKEDSVQNFIESYAEEGFNTESRYAARLSFQRRHGNTHTSNMMSMAQPPAILEESEEEI